MSPSPGPFTIMVIASVAALAGACAAWWVLKWRARRTTAEARRQRDAAAHATRAVALGGITASITHDINQSLGAILSNAEAGEILLGANDPPLGEVKEILRDIQRDGLRADAIVRRVRSFLQRRATIDERVDLDEIIGEALALVRPTASRAAIAICVQTDDACDVTGDRAQLEQAILNLLLNGVDAMRLGTHKELVVRTEADEETIRMRVIDRGHGIDARVRARMFEWFVSTKPDGLGIGLPIARMLIEQHGGGIEASNNPHGGATFTITLPRARL